MPKRMLLYAGDLRTLVHGMHPGWNGYSKQVVSSLIKRFKQHQSTHVGIGATCPPQIFHQSNEYKFCTPCNDANPRPVSHGLVADYYNKE